MRLRFYQQEAYDAAIASLEAEHHPVLQLATGTGKSLIIAALAEHYRQTDRRVWALTHVQQLVEQNAATYERYSGVDPGIVCAGLKRKDRFEPVTFGTIQTMLNVQIEMEPPDLIIIDEAHRVPHNKGERSLYESVLSRYPNAGRVAMTATPWRMDNGVIHGEGDQFWFDQLSYSYTVPRAVGDGYLCPLVGVETTIQLDLEGARKANGDFVMTDVDSREDVVWLRAVARSLPELTAARKHIAVYCPTIDAAERAAEVIAVETGWVTDVMAGSITRDERSDSLRRFKSGETRVLCSVDMITTGFDFPALDCIVCLRPTLSSSLWVQIQGRGTRLADGKKNCLILDFVGNLQRLGGVDMYENFYKEESKEEVEAIPAKERALRERAKVVGAHRLLPIDPMTGEIAKHGAILMMRVESTHSVVIRTKYNPTTPILLINYNCVSEEGIKIRGTTFLNTEVPDRKTLKFFESRQLAVNLPSPADNLTWQMKGARVPDEVSVRKSGQYWNVVEEFFYGDTE
jgi:DNA repair protein RadD